MKKKKLIMKRRNNNIFSNDNLLASGGSTGVVNAIAGGTNVLSSWIPQANDATFGDLDYYDAAINNQSRLFTNINSNSDLLSLWNNYSALDNVNWKDLKAQNYLGTANNGSVTRSTASGVLSGAASGAAIGSVIPGIGTAIGAGIGGIVSGIGSLFGSKRKKRKVNNTYKNLANDLNERIDLANQSASANFLNSANNLSTQSGLSSLANFAAYGGSLPQIGSVALEYGLADSYAQSRQVEALGKLTQGLNTYADGGGIHIKKANRGKFTESAKRAGMGVLEFASHVLANKDDYSSTQVKRANFARNASKWHALGGSLGRYINNRENITAGTVSPYGAYLYAFGGSVPPGTHPTLSAGSLPPVEAYNKFAYGGDFSNGVTTFDSGGTHESNPMGGIPLGIGENGLLNLVEEGEVKFDDYVYSDRITANSNLLSDVNLRPTKSKRSYANLAENISKESAERPNDPISQRGLREGMAKLALALEILKMQEGKSDNSLQFRHGGKMNMYDSGGDLSWKPSLLDFTSKSANYLYSNLPEWLAQRRDVPLRSTINSGTNLNNITLNSPIVPNAVSDLSSVGNGFFGDFATNALRYSPILGSAISVGSDLLGKTNRPRRADFSNADRVNIQADSVAATPIGNYLSYTPFDRNYYTNLLNANAGATRRAILNTSGGNRAQAQAGILAADYNSNNAIGALGRQAAEFNLSLRLMVEDFNRGTNQFNSQQALLASTTNALLGLLAQTAEQLLASLLRENEINRVFQSELLAAAARSANLTNLFNNLGNLGRERAVLNMIKSNPSLYYSITGAGNINYKGG